MKINKSSGQISSMLVKMKDGGSLHYVITKFTPNLEMSDSKFSFDKKKNPGVTVEEL